MHHPFIGIMLKYQHFDEHSLKYEEIFLNVTKKITKLQNTVNAEI